MAEAAASGEQLAECQQLLAQARTERARRVLRRELAGLQDAHRAALSEGGRSAGPAPAPGDHRITTYAWDQTAKFVKLYVTLPDVQSLPEGSVTCTFAPDELDLRVRGTDGKEKYLLVRPLHEPIDPAASSFSVKSNRVLVKLCKASAGTEWRSVDDSARRDQERKQDKAASNQGKSTAQLLSELYGDADEEAKKKLEEAWEKGREKREAR